MNLTHRTVRSLEKWAVDSQQNARRNAMLAATEMARRRAERLDVEEFLATRTAQPPSSTRKVAAHGQAAQ